MKMEEQDHQYSGNDYAIMYFRYTNVTADNIMGHGKTHFLKSLWKIYSKIIMDQWFDTSFGDLFVAQKYVHGPCHNIKPICAKLECEKNDPE